MGIQRVAYMNVGTGCVATHVFLESCAQKEVGICLVGECWVVPAGNGTQSHPDYVMLGNASRGTISKKKFRRDALHLQVRPIPAPHFIVRQKAPCIYLSALSALKFHLSPDPQLHLPARPIHTHTSTFPSLLLGQLARVARLGTYTRPAP